MLEAPKSLPPACADCLSTMESKLPGQNAPQQFASKLFRATDGKMRIDSGNTSMITDPKTGESILLDHLAKEARRISPPQLPQLPGGPAMPGMPGFATPKPANIINLGKALIQGHEAEGMKYVFQPPAMPAAPQLPDVPQPPGPGLSELEVWTSTKLGLPVLTKTTGAFGMQMCHCKFTDIGEPAASLFQIPPEYKLVAEKAAPVLPK